MLTRKTRPHSLLIVRPTLTTGGADRVTITLLQSFDRTKVTPSLVLFRREGPYLEDVPEDVPIFSLEASSLWTAWRPLARHIRESSPDILLSTCSGTNVVACIASLLSGQRARLILSERNVLLRDQPFAKKWLMLFAKRLLYRSADAITAVSRGVANDLTEKLSLKPDQISVVYNPIVGAELEVLAAEKLEEPPYDDDTPIVLAAGRLVQAKGFDTLLEAFAEVSRQSTANLVIIGDGPLRNSLVQRANRLGIGTRVFLPGFVRNPFKYMARATVFVLSSRFEGLPGVLIQAMACGAAVVATRCPAGPEEIITHGRDGFLVPVDSSDDMARRLQELLDRPVLRSHFGAAARNRVQAFRTDIVIHNYLQAILGESIPDSTAPRLDPVGVSSPCPEFASEQPKPQSDGSLR